MLRGLGLGKLALQLQKEAAELAEAFHQEQVRSRPGAGTAGPPQCPHTTNRTLRSKQSLGVRVRVCVCMHMCIHKVVDSLWVQEGI